MYSRRESRKLIENRNTRKRFVSWKGIGNYEISMELSGDGPMVGRPRDTRVDGPRHAGSAHSVDREGTPQLLVAELDALND